LESLLNALETKERQKGSPLTDQEIKDIQDALLNDITLESLVVSGRSYFSTSRNDSFYNSRKIIRLIISGKQLEQILQRMFYIQFF
jgi:hypothetical protein